MYKIPDDFKFSWSAFEFYQNCPYKFAKIYLEKHKEPSNIFALLGCALHILFKEIYVCQNFNSKRAYAIWEKILDQEYKTNWKQYQYGHIKQEEVDKIKFLGFKLIKKFFLIIQKEDLEKEVLGKEEKIKGKYKNHSLTAIIDLIINTKFGLTVIDYKTGKPNDKHIHQLLLYAALYQKKTGKKVDAVAIIYVSSGKVLYYKITEELKQKTGKYINEIYNKIISDLEFKPKKNDYCDSCSLKKDCPAWTN